MPFVMPQDAGTFRYNAEEYSKHFKILLRLANVWKEKACLDNQSDSEDDNEDYFDARQALDDLIVAKINALLKFEYWAGEERTVKDMEGALEIKKLLGGCKDEGIAEDFKGIEKLYLQKLKAMALRK